MTPDPSHSSSKAQPTGSLEREESQLWRWLLGFMVLLSFALAALLWERLENIPFSLRAIPIGVPGSFAPFRGVCLRAASRG